MKQLLLSLLLFVCSSGFAQSDSTKGTIKAGASPCYDVQLTIGGQNNSVFTYHQARGYAGFVGKLNNCMKNATVKIVSYNLSVNGGKPIAHKGPNFDFSNIDAYKAQKLSITDCLVEIAVEGEPVKTKLLPKTEFTIIGEP